MLFMRVNQLRDVAVLDGSRRLAAEAATNLAELLAHLAVIKQRRLFAPIGYPSIHDFCVHELGLSEDATGRRLTAARLAADHPPLFEAIADQRLSLSTALLLSPYVGAAPIAELISGLAHKTHAAAKEWLATRFPQSALPTRMEFVGADGSRTPADTGATSKQFDGNEMGQLATSRSVHSDSSESTQSTGPLPRGKVIPLNAEQVAYQFTVDRETHELLLRAQEVVGRAVSPGDLAAMFKLGMKAVIREGEKSRHGLHREDHGSVRADSNSRYIPARVKAEVYTRDEGRCAFVSDEGTRCACRADLEYDHIQPRAHGGRSTPDNLRLLCPAHNQYEADRKLGKDFMDSKRPRPAASQPAPSHEFPGARDVRAALITLGFRKEDVNEALAYAAGLPATLSAPERVKAILKRRGSNTHEQPSTAAPA